METHKEQNKGLIDTIKDDLIESKQQVAEKKTVLEQHQLKLTSSEMSVWKLAGEVAAKDQYIEQVQNFYDQTQGELKAAVTKAVEM